MRFRVLRVPLDIFGLKKTYRTRGSIADASLDCSNCQATFLEGFGAITSPCCGKNPRDPGFVKFTKVRTAQVSLMPHCHALLVLQHGTQALVPSSVLAVVMDLSTSKLVNMMRH